MPGCRSFAGCGRLFISEQEPPDVIHHILQRLPIEGAAQAAAVLGDADQVVPHQNIQVMRDRSLRDLSLIHI